MVLGKQRLRGRPFGPSLHLGLHCTVRYNPGLLGRSSPPQERYEGYRPNRARPIRYLPQGRSRGKAHDSIPIFLHSSHPPAIRRTYVEHGTQQRQLAKCVPVRCWCLDFQLWICRRPVVHIDKTNVVEWWLDTSKQCR